MRDSGEQDEPCAAYHVGWCCSPDRFLVGSDVVAPKDSAQYYAVFDRYRPLLALLTPDASQKPRKGNYERLFDRARTMVRSYERAQGFEAAGPR